MADNTTELEVLDQIVEVLGGTSGQYETIVPVLQQIYTLLEAGITDPEAIAEAVHNELVAHPEWTTTVQDGSITNKKLAADVRENVENVDELDTVIDVVYPTNLYDGQYLDGYMTQYGVLGEGDAAKYAHMKPTLLMAGDYLFKSRSKVFGTTNGRNVYVLTRSGSYIDKIVPTVLVEDSVNGNDLCKFTLAEPTYVTINVGSVLNNGINPQYSEATFMLVAGSTVDDWPSSYVRWFAPYSGSTAALVNGCGGLIRKVAIFDGDSIGQGISVGSTDPTYGYGYAGRIGEANIMMWRNYSISGGVISSASTEGLSGRHSVLDNIDTMYADFPDADYIIFEGGTNDADLLGNAIEDPTVLGTLDPSDFTGPFDTSTFTGALDTIFSKAISYWKGKQIGFVIAQKMGRYQNYDAQHSNRRAYFERVMQVCDKWGIPYLNLWDGCYMNPMNPSCYDNTMTADQNIAAGNLYTDGQHLTAKGYDYISPMVEAWMKTL